jgi:hypothetical protein
MSLWGSSEFEESWKESLSLLICLLFRFLLYFGLSSLLLLNFLWMEMRCRYESTRTLYQRRKKMLLDKQITVNIEQRHLPTWLFILMLLTFPVLRLILSSSRVKSSCPKDRSLPREALQDDDEGLNFSRGKEVFKYLERQTSFARTSKRFIEGSLSLFWQRFCTVQLHSIPSSRISLMSKQFDILYWLLLDARWEIFMSEDHCLMVSYNRLNVLLRVTCGINCNRCWLRLSLSVSWFTLHVKSKHVWRRRCIVNKKW